MSEDTYTEKEFHKKMAVDLFNSVWSFLDKKERTAEEEDEMVHAAHASRYHWGQIGSFLEKERGEWQISRVYSVLKRLQPALYHAQRCLEICKENNIGDFDIAFAYEAMARAYAVSGEKTESKKYIELAKKAGNQIENAEDKRIFFGDLETVPGYQE
ncbi:MAG: hypothetical protein HXS46_13385 [Theionarchaea archaeon]|nr:MAG: hypothetical protein AYK18_15010 [Theionarchaea archaeon DG-70]MBU7011674.1 hypothetical protein [Theionarchaea archaeon]